MPKEKTEPSSRSTSGMPQEITVEPTLTDILQAIKGIGNRVETLEKARTPMSQPELQPKAPETPVVVKPPEQDYPVPMDYKNILDIVLNARFGIKVVPSRDQPNFALTIIVPKEYSNMPAKDWTLTKADMRTKVISYAEAVNGVRQWCEAIYKQLGSTMQSQIVADRAKLVQAQENAL